VKFLRKADGKINWWLFGGIVLVAFVVREAVYLVLHV
jgi:hypothetical protein